ncbi:MAG: zinc-ribbon domain containing protein [Selenomonas sp.]|nr:zinc-ribbon domain containing protein [Selenomonas sp.]
MNSNNVESKEEYARRGLENYVKDWKIFLDTCSCLHFAADKFWMNIIPLLQQYQKKIIIPLRCIEELQKHAGNQEKKELSESSLKALKIMQQLIKAGYVDVRGEDRDDFADEVFQEAFLRFRRKYKLLLITQDNGLAKDILKLNESESVRGYSVHVKRLNKYGFLSCFAWAIGNGKVNSGGHQGGRNSGTNETEIADSGENSDEELDTDEGFELCSKVTDIEDTPLPISHISVENDTVYTSAGIPILLEKEVAAGGEGIIYTTNSASVAKIYKQKNNTLRKYEKIKCMLSKNIAYEGICYPIEALYNEQKEFVGYLMPEAKGRELQKSIFIKPLFLKHFPGWKKRDTVELCITIMEKIKYLHDRNIILGDINPANILVVSPREVYFVDTDSYQIEGFPCPVGTATYTAPEIQRKNFTTFLRTMGNENFAVATLLFMIMLPGKPPYSQQGGDDLVNNIIRMDFSYPFGESSNKKTPDGPWRYIWSHLTYDLKSAFYNTFRQGGEYSAEETRQSVDEWLSIFRYYLSLLDEGKYGRQDAMSEELFPTRFKKNRNLTYTTCKICGGEVAENQCRNGICPECLKKGEVYYCKQCGKEILYTNFQKYVKNVPKHAICAECFAHANDVQVVQVCVDCGKHFELTNRQCNFFKNKGLDLPKRCPACREAKKHHSQPVITPRRPVITPRRPVEVEKSKGSFCFISTAVCEFLGKPDDCTELQMLRHYRDSWLRNQPYGSRMIASYYNQAPLLVSRLKHSADYASCCQTLWMIYIQPCLALIQQQEFIACRDKYVEMVHYMQQRFANPEK